VAHCGMVGEVWDVRVSSGGGVVVRVVVGIIILHFLGRGEPELSPSLEAKSPLLGDSTRMASSDGDPLWVVPQHSTPKLPTIRWPIQVVEVVGWHVE
jgi:hypothetical protein